MYIADEKKLRQNDNDNCKITLNVPLDHLHFYSVLPFKITIIFFYY